jgi:hypothetical protein
MEICPNQETRILRMSHLRQLLASINADIEAIDHAGSVAA